jgi:hypothetical protein
MQALVQTKNYQKIKNKINQNILLKKIKSKIDSTTKKEGGTTDKKTKTGKHARSRGIKNGRLARFRGTRTCPF